MPIVTFSEAFPRGRGGRRRRRGGRGESGGRGDGKSDASTGSRKAPQAFQGRGQSLYNAASAPVSESGTGVFANDEREASRPSFQDAMKAWQAKHDDAALLAVADRLVAEHHDQSATAEETHIDRQACEEPIDLCDSDDDAPPQQPAAPCVSDREAQPAARELEAKRRKAEGAQQKSHSALSGLGATRRGAALPVKQPPRAETRRLGIRDPPPPQLSGSNALLSSLAHGANRTKQACRKNSDWMFGGEGAYAPHPSSAVDMKLRLHEIVNVLDIGLVAHPARALLDSGNGGHTLITRTFAARLQLVDETGRPKQSTVRVATVVGVVAGASEQVPLMSLSYVLRGKRMHITAGVTEAKLGCDLLLSCREIAQFVSDGFTFDVR